MNSIGGLSSKRVLGDGPIWFDTRRWSSDLKTKSFCFESSSHA